MRAGAIRVFTSSMRQDWGTPRPIFSWFHAAFGFTRDVCAQPWSAKLKRYWTKRDNALAQSWRDEIGFDNPPYDHALAFTSHGKHEAIMGGVNAHLVPSRVETNWYLNATERDCGRLIRSYYDDLARVEWRIWSSLIVGIYHHDERIEFELPPGTVDEDGQPKKTSSALFPSSLLILAARGVRRRVQVRRPKDPWHPKFERPLLTWRMPET